MTTDFLLQNRGSIFILVAVSAAAQQWVTENLPGDALTWGRHGTVVEARYVAPIVAGIQNDGLEVQS